MVEGCCRTMIGQGAAGRGEVLKERKKERKSYALGHELREGMVPAGKPAPTPYCQERCQQRLVKPLPGPCPCCTALAGTPRHRVLHSVPGVPCNEA